MVCLPSLERRLTGAARSQGPHLAPSPEAGIRRRHTGARPTMPPSPGPVRLKSHGPSALISPADVVTGAAGFVGSHLVSRLLAQGRPVVGIDSFDDYYDRVSKERNIAVARRDPNFRFIERDLLSFDPSSEWEPGCRVFHLAAQPGVRGSWGTHFERYLRNNVLVTQHLLEAAVKVRPSRFVYASSSSIYGEQPTGPTPETALPNPVSPYGMTKLAGEHLGRLYAHAHGLSVVSLRFFTVYGPGQRPDMAFHRFIEAIRAGKPVTLYGDGHQTRDFTFVDDIVEGILSAGSTAGIEGAFNLGGGTPAPLTEVLRILGELAGHPVETQSGEAPRGDPRATWADTRRARDLLGFRPQVSLTDGLRRQWNWQTRPQ
jgi:nucleoside-diphosphate-sugar epimerase